MDLFTFANGALANYKSLHITTSDYVTGPYRVCFMTGSTAVATISFYSAGQKDLDFSVREETKNIDLTQITSIKFGGASGEGSIKITQKPYLQKPMSLTWGDDGTAEIDLTDLTASGGFSLNHQTGVLTGTGGSGSLSVNFPAGGVDLTSLTGFSVTYTGDNLFGNFEVGNGTTNKGFWSNVTGREDLNQYMTVENVGDPSAITNWKWNDNSTAGTMTISSIKLKGGVITASNPHETLLTTLTYVGGDCSNEFGTTQGQAATIYGKGWGIDGANYVDLAGYDEMHIYGTPSKGVRLLFNYDNEPTKVDVTFDLNGEGYYSYNLSALTGRKLNAIKFPYDGKTGVISKVVLYKNTIPVPYSFVISGVGQKTPSATAALADATVTSIDATGLTNTSAIALESANPNCLFKANAGKLSNTNNVIVSDACAKLELTDGKPFKAPSEFTATAAPTYDRTFTASATTTVCLPFALTAAEAATLGTFYELSSFDGSTLHFTSVNAPVANKAYLVVPTATSLTLSETGKSIVATPADLGTAITNVDFIGTLAATTIPASDGTYSYFAYNDGSLVKIVTNAATLPAFRGYFKVSTSSSARSLNISFDNEATGISAIENVPMVMDNYYDLQGRRVLNPTKGLYIVNGKKVIK